MNDSISFYNPRRLAWTLVLAAVLAAGLVVPVLTAAPVQAQGGSRAISVGDVVSGTLDSANIMQAYSLRASAGDTITIDVTTDTDELAPVVMVTDDAGAIVAQDLDLSTAATANLVDLELPTSGTYYILVMRGSGAEGTASGSFTLALTGIQQIGGQTVTLPNGGITFELQWLDAVNLDLEVRDPVGGAIFNESPGSGSGGVLDADINANCAAAISDNPTETIAWPAGTVPAGSYEAIVYYTDACGIGGPQVFTLSASVNGQEQQVLTGTINPGQEYLARVVLDANSEWSLVNGGVNAGLNVTVFSNQIANASPVALGSTVSGTVSNITPAQAYTFNATAGTTVNVNMTAQTGSLDTYVALLGPNGAILATNDDAPNTTNSSLSQSVAVDGTYTVIATRYGLSIGGTEGEYNLSVTGAQSATAADTTGTGTGTVIATPIATAATGTGATTPAVTALPDGAIEVKLEWATEADLQLQVRDPRGDTVFDDQPIITSGGELIADGNVRCENPTSSPVSYIYWPQNRLQPGTYEVEVWFQNTCDDPRSVDFGLSVDVNNQTIINTNQPSSPNSRYMITFNVQPDGTAVAGPGDFFEMSNAQSLDYQAALPNAQTISYGGLVSGSITDQQRYVVYAFEAQAGDRVTIGMDATGGTLDPALYLITPENFQLAFNDDVTPGIEPNSVIEKVTLPSAGTYYIIATHYGLHVGGTQGSYTLTLVQD